MTNESMGGDPHFGNAKQILIKYKPCEDWERGDFEQALTTAKQAIAAERYVLRATVHKIRTKEIEHAFETEWVQYFLQSEDSPSAPEVVEIDVRGESVCVKRSSLLLCADSELARCFSAEAWAQNSAAGGNGSDDESEDSDDSDAHEVFIERSPYCFRKMVDQLRMIEIAKPGEPSPPPLIVAEHE